MKVTHVAYAANEYGYTVRILSGNYTVDEYNGGNDPRESTSVIDPGRDSIPALTLLEYAKETALEFASQYQLSENNIQENFDLLDN